MACAREPDPASKPDPRLATAVEPAHGVAAAPPVDDEWSIAARADEARAVIEARCGNCHRRDISVQPGALAVFDLWEEDWSAELDERQRVDVEHRLVDGGASYDEVDAVRMYLEAARQRRLSPDPDATITDC